MSSGGGDGGEGRVILLRRCPCPPFSSPPPPPPFPSIALAETVRTNVAAALDQAAKSAPAGSDVAVAAVKSAIAAANSPSLRNVCVCRCLLPFNFPLIFEN